MMSSCKCWGGKSKLCPISFGLALGITSGLAVLLWMVWVVYHGATPMMIEFHIPVPSIKDGSIHAAWMALKGFVFGFFVALIYDLCVCCCRCKCCKKSDCKCGCCSNDDKASIEMRNKI